MDASKLLSMVKTALESNPDYYTFAAMIVESQKEEDAKVAEAFERQDIAEAIRA